MRIEIDPGLLDQLYELDKRDRKELGDLIQEVRRSFGQPHLHAGTGIRDLLPGVYECRRNLHQRLVFTAHKGYLYFHLLGNHGEVKRFLRGL